MEVPFEMLKRYIERRKKDLEDCFKWIKDRNFENLERVGHQLKGNGQTFGFEELSKIGLKMEDAAKLKDLDRLQVVLNDLNVWIKKNLN